MLVKISKEPNNHSGARIRRCIGLLLTLCFFLGVVGLAMHHHSVSFQLKSCSICKAKTYYSGTPNKIKADLPVSIETVNHCSVQNDFTYSRNAFAYQTPFIASLLPNPFSNKAPPLTT
jgi:hypothetical protein